MYTFKINLFLSPNNKKTESDNGQKDKYYKVKKG